MAYDEDLADRMRELVAAEPGVTEMKMFGGLAFLVHGNMAVAASGQGGALVHIDPADSAKLTATSAAEPMVMRGKPMEGWLRVPDSELRTAAQLKKWVHRGVEHARSLPPKEKKKR